MAKPQQQFEAVIGIEVHAELKTKTKMFCGCPVVDPNTAEPNTAVCPVCAGMPGTLPVVNKQAVEFAIRVAAALNCEIAKTSIFARKNYFYPDLPKGYQISQYEHPLARHGSLKIRTSRGEKSIRIRRVHMEEDTGKLTHVPPTDGKRGYSLIDLNRAGVPLLEIVSEPDIRTAEEARLYAMTLRNILRYLGVNSGDMQKGAIRIEPNVSIRPVGSHTFGTRTEIKNLNSFRALERAIAYEIQRQESLLLQGKDVVQQTMGWDENKQKTFPQRTKEAEEDYRYLPEPDLPPLVIENEQIERITKSLPELPTEKYTRFLEQYQLPPDAADLLVSEPDIADFFESTTRACKAIPPKRVANWIVGELFSLINQANLSFEAIKITPEALSKLIMLVDKGNINNTTGKTVLAEMFQSGEDAQTIIAKHGYQQISDVEQISAIVQEVIRANPKELQTYLNGKETIVQWFFGQVMRATKGKANPQIIKQELERQLTHIQETHKAQDEDATQSK